MAKSLVIVESPTKAKTIEKFLGKDFEVVASYGHVRDLPDSASEIPESVKKEKWARLGINIEKDFEPLYIVPPAKKKRVAELKSLLKNAKEVLLATDEDREGESISWHLLEVLKPKVPFRRLVFHEITKEAIAEAVASPRDLDEHLVKAQETRRIIDRLFGYSVSPLLWKKVRPRLSAGRVQSVAIRLLVERERERIKFKKSEYWDLKARFKKDSEFDGELTYVDSKRVASGKDFDPNTGKLNPNSDVILLNKASAEQLRQKLSSQTPVVSSVEEKPYTTRPSPPFTTSTLQQEANRKLSFSAKRTMQVAQSLYENGFITYMRTDSTSLSQEALKASRDLIKREFGDSFLHPEPRLYQTKVKNAQEAHEAIRPAGSDFTPIAEVRRRLGDEAARLYELIWKRMVACQMKDAQGTRIAVQITCDNAQFRASGKTIDFAGFLRAYVEGADDPESDLADQERVLPKLAVGDKVNFVALDALSHETQPPARYTEGSLIKELERLGIGRPSTWATIVDVVLSRDYAFKRGSALVPTFLACAVTGLMEGHFITLLDYEFTARLEDDLDAIARGERESLKYLGSFFHGNGHPGLKTLVHKGEEEIDPRIVCGIPIGTDSNGTQIEVRIGRYGPFLSNGEVRASLPDSVAPDELTVARASEILEEAKKGPESLGNHPETGLPIYLKTGRFGPYVQMGQMVEGGDKPKMASLLQGMLPADVNLEIAVKLLSLPKTLGKNPENNEDVIAANGPYGPYVKSGSEIRSLSSEDVSIFDLTLERALEVLKQPKRRGRGSTPKALREIGEHPVSKAKLVIKSGRFGPYVTDGTINASLPRGADPAAITVEDAVNLLVARAAKIAEMEASGETPKKRKRPTKKKS